MPNPNELSGGDTSNDILAKRFTIQPNPAPFMASEIFPTIVLENDRPEFGFLGHTRLCWGQGADGSSLGNFSHVGLLNPASSNLLAVVQRIIIPNHLGAAQGFQIRMTGTVTPFDSQAAGWMRDSRLGFNSGFRSTVQVGDATSASSLGNLVARIQIPADVTFVWDMPVVLGPTSQLYVTPNTNDTAVRADFVWYERAAEPGELQNAQGA